MPSIDRNIPNSQIEGENPTLWFKEIDQTDPAGRFRISVRGGKLYVEKAISADWATSRSILARTATKVVASYNASDECKEQADYVCDYVTDVATIQSALTAAGDKNVVCSTGDYNWEAPLTLTAASDEKWQSLEFCDGAVIYPSVNGNIFNITQCVHLSGGVIRCDYLPTFSNAIFNIAGSGNVLSNVKVRGTAGTGTGKVFNLTAGSTSIAYNMVDLIKIYGFEYGIYPTNEGVAQAIFGNDFRRIRMDDTVYALYEDMGTLETIHGNTYDIFYQSNTDTHATECFHLEGSRSEYKIQHYDFAGTQIVNLASNSYGNRLRINGGTSYLSKITDSGRQNTVIDDYAGVTRQNLTYKIQNHATSPSSTNEFGDVVIHTNFGATDTITIPLPELPWNGMTKKFVVLASYALRVDPYGTVASAYITINGAKQAVGKYISCATINSSVTLTYDTATTSWVATETIGTWTVET